MAQCRARTAEYPALSDVTDAAGRLYWQKLLTHRLKQRMHINGGRIAGQHDFMGRADAEIHAQQEKRMAGRQVTNRFRELPGDLCSLCFKVRIGRNSCQSQQIQQRD